VKELQEAIGKVREARPDLEVSDKGRMLCPFHGERKPSAYLWCNPHHKYQVEFHCFGCGKSVKFEALYRILTDKEYKQKELKKQRTSYIDLELLSSRSNAQFLLLLKDEKLKERFSVEASSAKTAVEYLEKRGIDIEAIKKYQIGFVIREQLVGLEGIKDNGWAKDKSRYCFLTFPIKNQKGKVVTVQFEDFMNREKREDTKLNLRGRPLSLWYSKIPDEENKKNEEWVVTESIYDAISFDLTGVKAIALLGQPSFRQIEELKEFKHLVLALDNDKTGKETKINLAKELYPYTITLKELKYPEGIKDPNELLQKQGIDGIVEVLEKAKDVDLFPPLIDTIGLMVQSYKRSIELAIKIPDEMSFLIEFLPNGLVPGLYALAGMPGAGKTTILNQLADALAKDEVPTIYFLTEEPDYRLIIRTLKKEGLERMGELRSNQPKILEYRRIFEMSPDYTAQKLKDIIQGIKLRLEAEGKHHLVFILDSLQALRVGKGNKRLDARAKTILKTEYLAHITRDLEIPVIFTSFMAREYYPRNGSKKPKMAIFKESGDIEYLVDVGMCLWVEKEDILNESNPGVGLYFVKNRFGKQGSCQLKFIVEECRFENPK